MTWIKDLGNVKGETGDIYIPELTVTEDGLLHFGWTKATEVEAQDILTRGKDLPMPVYIPGNPDPQGNVTFAVSDAVKNTYGAETFKSKTMNLRGPAGSTTTIFEIQSFSGDINDVPEEERHTSVFYVEETDQIPKVYIYNGIKFIMIEGLDFSNYYTKSETYSKNELDAIFSEINSQQELTAKLLDIEETFLAFEESNENFNDEENIDNND